jgi:putative flippase GtrA
MKKIDVVMALVTGEITAWLFYTIISNFGFEIGNLVWVLALAFPFLAWFCLWVCYQIGKKFLFVFQMAKYLLVGILATLVDLGIMNLLMFVSGFSSGLPFALFKATSFLIATFTKYFGDKFWAFEQMDKEGMKKELGQFYLVTLVGMAINVFVASFVVDFLGMHIITLFGSELGMTAKMIANIGGIAAALAAAVWNFFGYKFIVFKK